MKKRRLILRKTVSLITGFLLVFQSLTPGFFISSRISAQEATASTEVVTPTPTLEPTSTETPTPTAEITPIIVPTIIETPIPTEKPTPTIEPTTNPPATTPTEEPKNNSPPTDDIQGEILDGVSAEKEPTATPTIGPIKPETGEIQAIILKNIAAPTLDLDGVNPDGSASLSTDKADYAPTDTAIITGSNLTAGKTYTLTISSSDKPAVSKTTSVTADDQGTFIYAYQLDGKYRPNYNVELRNREEQTVASVTFTDSPTVTPSFNGTESGNIATSNTGVVSGTLTGTYTLVISGNVTAYTANSASFIGTVADGIIGSITANINSNGIDTMSGLITGTGASDPVRIIGTFPKTGNTGDFVGEIITGPTPIYVSNITLSGTGDATTVDNGSTLQMLATISPSDAANKNLAWSIWWDTTNVSHGEATINENTGLLTATKVGPVTVVAKALDGSLKDATKAITVTTESAPACSSGVLNGDGTSDTVQLVLTCTNAIKFVHSGNAIADATDLVNIKWDSADNHTPSAATISGNELTLTLSAGDGTFSQDINIDANTLANNSNISNSTIAISSASIIDHAKPKAWVYYVLIPPTQYNSPFTTPIIILANETGGFDFGLSNTEGGNVTYGGGCTAHPSSVGLGASAQSLHWGTGHSFPDGIYDDCTITITDASGNFGVANYPTFIVDTTGPVTGDVTITPLYSNGGINYISALSNISAPVTDAGVGVDGSTCQWFFDNGNNSGSSSTTNYIEGECVFTHADTSIATGINVRAQYDVGSLHSSNLNPAKNVPVTVDATAPTTTDTFPSTWQNSTTTVTLTCNDGSGSGCSKVYYSTDGSVPTTSSSFVNSSSSWQFTVSTGGQYTIKYFGVDNVGNQETVKTATNTLNIDSAAPVGGSLTMKTKLHPTGITVANPDGSGVYTITPALSMTGLDVFNSLDVIVTDDNLNISDVPVYIDGTSADKINGAMVYDTTNHVWNYANQTKVETFTTGAHNLVATFFDNAGNTKQLTVRFTTDNTGPTLTIAGFTADGTNMPGSVDGGYTLNTNNVGSKEYLIQFKTGTISSEPLANEYFELKLKNTSTVSAADLKTYYAANTSGDFLTYLNGAADGINAFAYIKGNGTTAIQLIDGARHQTFAGSQDLSMAIPGDAPLGTYILEGKIKDVIGNETTVTYTLIVAGDRIAPTIDTVTDITEEATGPTGATVTFTPPMSHDAIDGDLTSTCNATSGSTFELKITTVTCSKTDTSGNTGTSSFTITVQDTTVPVITLNGIVPDIEINDTYTEPGATATDIVDGTFAATPTGSVTTTIVGSYDITYDAIDTAGNHATSVVRTVKVIDSIANAFDIISATLAAPGSDIANNLNLVDTNNITRFSGLYFEKSISGTPVGRLTFTGTLDLSDTTTQNFLRALGTKLDQGNGRIDFDARTSEIFRLAGATLIMYNMPAGITSAQLIVRNDLGTILDPSSIISGFTQDPTTYDISFTTAHFTKFDIDTIAPTIDTVGNITKEATSHSGAVATFTVPMSHDAIDGDIASTCNATSGSTFALGITTVTCSKTDTAGNTGTNSFTITVKDTTAPIISTHSNMTVEVNSTSGATVTYTAPNVTDNFDNDFSATCSPASGTVFSYGTTTVYCNATDTAGNNAIQTSFTVTVSDTTAPAAPNITSSSHVLSTWNQDRTINIRWSAPTDYSNINGYSYQWDRITNTIPDQVSEGTATTMTSTDRPTSQLIYFHIRARDGSGNWSDTTHYGPFWIDAADPTTSWTGPSNGDYVKGVVTLSANANDVGSGINFVRFRYQPSGGIMTTIGEDTSSAYSTNWDTTGLAEGSYLLRVRAEDNSGRYLTKDITVSVDNKGPAEPTADPAANDYTSDQSVTLTSSDAGSGLDAIYYTIDGTEPDNSKTEYTGAITVNHSLTLKAIAYDKLGNASTILTALYGIAPVISLETGATIGDTSVTITWTTDDPATSRVIYDTVSHPEYNINDANYGYAFTSAEDETKVTSHSVNLTGLISETTYYYRVISHGSPETVGQEQSFNTTKPSSSNTNSGGSGTGDGLSDGLSDGRSDGRSSGSSPSLATVLGTYFFGFGETGETVLGAEATGSSLTPTPTGLSTVLGTTQTTQQNNMGIWVWIILGIILLLIGLYLWWKSRKNK